jgi:hypothetical protein
MANIPAMERARPNDSDRHRARKKPTVLAVGFFFVFK